MSADTTLLTRLNCSPLSPDDLDRFWALLRAQQTDILRSCQGLSHAALRKSGDAGCDASVTEEAADLASDVCEQDLSLNFLGRARLELSEVTEALGRIDRRSYGVCEACGRGIPLARLEALPAARACVECKWKSEAA